MGKKILMKRFKVKNVKGEKKLISIVKEPAIITTGLYFNDEPMYEIKMSVDKDKMMLVGPTMIPDMDLVKNIGGEICSIVFTKEEVKNFIVEWGNQNGDKINFDHTGVMVKALIVNSIILETKHDTEWIKNKWGYDLPIGTHWLELKIEDEKFWKDMIKDKGYVGFSIESIFNFNLDNYEMAEVEINFSEEKMDKVIDLIVKDLVEGLKK